MSAEISDILNFLFLPFVMSIMLAGIHCYLGFHVLERGVIFVDLSLAQVAALGSTLALALGFDHHDAGSYFVSLTATLLAAALFSRARRLESKVPLEAMIGIVYAFASAVVILVLDHMAHGSEHIKGLLVGKLLWVTPNDVLKVAIIYSLVAAVHYRYRKQFFAASAGRLQKARGWWDFAFYALFGIIITSSVHVAGVLQVFAYLIVPSILANIWFTRFRSKLIFGWVFGLIVSTIAMAWSYLGDLPSGAATVTLFTLFPILLILFLPKRSRVDR